MKNSHAYVFVHDENIINEFEKTKKLTKTFKDNYSYVFVGNKPISLKSSNIIVCRDLPDNIEQYPKLVTYTGWYALVRNNYIQHDYNFMLEYDTVFHPKFDEIVTKYVKQSKMKEVYSFISVPKDYFFYEYIPNELVNIDKIKQQRDKFIEQKGNEKWMGSSNSLWEKETLKRFVEWFDTLLEYKEDLINYEGIGHFVERALTIFCIYHSINYKFISGVLEHYYLDSHQTQAIHNNGIQKDYNQYLKELSSK